MTLINYYIQLKFNIYNYLEEAQKHRLRGEPTSLPDSGIRTCGTTLRTTRILKLAREPLTLAPAAGRRNEDPIGEKHRSEQRPEPLQQLPTCTHRTFLEFSGRISRRGPHATRYANGKQATIEPTIERIA